MIVRRFLIPLGLLAGAAALVLSCRDATPVGVDARTSVLLAGRHAQPPAGDDRDDDGDEIEDGDSLVSCRPLPYDSVTRTIGPEGGELEVGRNWLVIPQGALRDPVSITAVAPSDTVAMVRFRPEGLRFLSTALLVLTYDNCRIPRPATPRIALVTDSYRVIEFLTSEAASPSDHRLPKGHQEGHRRVVGELHHFSNYAVAW
ncbi:MAG: hypothetical protein DMD64_00410 [Gemmatimonadetes bacterium]|nr:MAG: hypothetical protein DMD64_00410 [Gemmatimonadota bacterium]